MKKIRIGGVPEHFNLPWHLNMEDGTFRNNGIQLFWKDFPDGTGAMCKALRNKDLDVAIILTEGIVKDIVEGSPTKIVQEYIASPLIWSIHVAANSNYKELEDLKDAKVAISRYGSGSHLMAYVNAQNLGWNPKNLNFEVVKNIDGAIEALNSGKADYFLWEHFTTKPLVDKGVFRRLGDSPTPWPCFVIAVRQDFLENNYKAIHEMLAILNNTTKNFKEIPAIETILSRKYNQKQEDIELWLSLTHWSQKQISVAELNKVQGQLLELDLIPKMINSSDLIDHFTK